MKTKRLMLMGCFAAAALITSPALGEMHKKSMATSASKSQRLAPRTTQVTPAKRHATMQTTPMYRRGSSSRYTGTRQYAGTRYYGSTRYGATGYYGGSRYYSGGGGWFGVLTSRTAFRPATNVGWVRIAFARRRPLMLTHLPCEIASSN